MSLTASTIFIITILSFNSPDSSSEMSKTSMENRENPTSEYDRLLSDGVTAFYETDWSRAREIFGEMKKINGDDPRAFFLESLIPFWAYFFGSEKKKYVDEYMGLSREAITLSQQHLRKHPRDTSMVLMLSGLYGYQSLMAASEGNYRTAIKSAMDGFKYTRQMLKLDSNDPRALIGKGIFNYMMGTIPSEAKWVTNIMGLKGEKELGFRLLKQASETDSYVSIDAKMMLYYLYEREEELQKAYELILELAEEYPENIIFRYKLAECLNRLGYDSEAQETYEKVVELNNSDLLTLKNKSISRIESIR